MIQRFQILFLVSFLLLGCEKQEEFPPRDNTQEVAEFYGHYNEQVKETVAREIEALQKELAEPEVAADVRAEKEVKLAKLLKRQQIPEYFSFKTIDDLPKDLNWVANWEEGEMGSDKAKKGGVFHDYITEFPATLRVIDDNSNNGFRSKHWDDVDLPLIDMHHNTGDLIPGVADRWAVSEDKQTVYFHIDEKATFSDGVPVETGDYFLAFYMRLGPYVHSPYGKEYFSTQFWNITSYDAKTFSIKLNNPKPFTGYFAGDLHAYPRHFYKEVGPDFVERYNWRTRPTTGAYIIPQEGIIKGRSVTLTRVKDWWAKDRIYTKNRFNADKVEYRLIRDAGNALEYFKRGKLDFTPLGGPKSWYEKTEFDAVFDGYIEKATFFAEYPAVPRGLYINCARPLLDQVDIRVGLQYATNFDKVIDFEYRGDAARCETNGDGYGRYSHPTIKARRYSVEKALESFAKAGFTKRGDDGVLRNEAGKRLSFAITYSPSPMASAIVARLKEEAIKAGVEYKLEGLDGSAAFLKGLEKKHELTLTGWGVQLPFPKYFQTFHSSTAFEKGTKTPKPMTNNFSSYADPEMDVVSQAVRDATTLEEIEVNSHRAEEIIHRDAPWIPGFKIPQLRCGYWRWVRWPDDFNIKLTRDLETTYLYWIDEDVKKETKKAMREGRTFPEKNLIFDQYKK